jgi:hypothetical protein
MTEANGQVGLLEAALDAAGGVDRWHRHNFLSAHLVQSGRVAARNVDSVEGGGAMAIAREESRRRVALSAEPIDRWTSPSPAF